MCPLWGAILKRYQPCCVGEGSLVPLLTRFVLIIASLCANLKEKCAASQRDLTLGCVFKVRLLWEITGRYRLSHLGPAIQLQMCFLLPGKEVAPLPRGCVQSQVCVGIRGLFQGMPGPWMRFPFSLSLQGKSVEIPGGAPQCGEAGKGRSRRLG